jgi:hypothetical protein
MLLAERAPGDARVCRTKATKLKPSIHAFTDTLAVRIDGGELVNRTDQANVVVMNDVALHQTARIVHRQRHTGPDALAFDRLIPALQFPFWE